MIIWHNAHLSLFVTFSSFLYHLSLSHSRSEMSNQDNDNDLEGIHKYPSKITFVKKVQFAVSYWNEFFYVYIYYIYLKQIPQENEVENFTNESIDTSKSGISFVPANSELERVICYFILFHFNLYVNRKNLWGYRRVID